MRAGKALFIAFAMVFSATVSHASTALTVVVFDYARTPHALLVSAVRVGEHAFHTAGIDTEWILCPQVGCSVPERYVVVKIVPHPLANAPISSGGLAATFTCGGPEHCAASYVFFDRAFDFAQSQDIPLDLTFGYVMVHEIGHLMGLGHRPGGIMMAVFHAQDLERAALGRLSFDSDEVREMRAAMERSQLVSHPAHAVRLHGTHTGAAE